MKYQVTTITIEHGNMVYEEIKEMVDKMFNSIAGDKQDMNIMAYSYKTSDQDNQIR